MMQTVEDCAKEAEKRTLKRGHGHRPTSSSQHRAKKHLDLGQSELQDKRKKKKVLQTKSNSDMKLEDRPPGEVDQCHNYKYFLQREFFCFFHDLMQAEIKQ